MHLILLIFFTKNSKEMKSSILPILAVLFLTACSKDKDEPTSKLGSDLTGTAKEVFDIVWQKEAQPVGGNHLVIDETCEFLNTETGAIITFTVDKVEPHSSDFEGEGDGVSFKGGGDEITIVKTDDATLMRVRCYLNGKDVMGRWYQY